MWKYSSHHNVWRAPDYATARHCEMEKMTEVAGRDLGGGCGKDDSLGPLGEQRRQGVGQFLADERL